MNELIGSSINHTVSLQFYFNGLTITMSILSQHSFWLSDFLTRRLVKFPWLTWSGKLDVTCHPKQSWNSLLNRCFPPPLLLMNAVLFWISCIRLTWFLIHQFALFLMKPLDLNNDVNSQSSYIKSISNFVPFTCKNTSNFLNFKKNLKYIWCFFPVSWCSLWSIWLF